MTTATPVKPEEFEDLLGDSTSTDLFNGEGKPTVKFRELLDSYARKHAEKNADLQDQIQEQVHEQLSAMLKDQNGGKGKVDLRPASSVERSAAVSAPGAKIDPLFDNHAEFLQAVWHRRDTLPNAEALRDKLAQASQVQNSYGTTIPADGGFLVPEELRQEIMTLSLEESITRSRATVLPMSSQTLTIPAVDETTHASQSLFGGVVCYWAAESAQFTESQAKFARVQLDVQKLIARADVPNELPEDAPAFLAWFMANMPRAVAWSEDYAFINGNGAGQPSGWLGASAAVSVAKQSGQAADTIVWENLVAMYSRMFPTSLARSVWVANIDTFPELASMALSVGTGGGPVWMSNGQEGPPMRILGRPVIFTEKVPTVGDAGDINLVDLGYYGIGDRQAMRLESSREIKFDYDETMYKLVQRVDGRPLLLSALTPAKSTSTLSAFVKIAARA